MVPFFQNLPEWQFCHHKLRVKIDLCAFIIYCHFKYSSVHIFLCCMNLSNWSYFAYLGHSTKAWSIWTFDLLNHSGGKAILKRVIRWPCSTQVTWTQFWVRREMWWHLIPSHQSSQIILSFNRFDRRVVMWTCHYYLQFWIILSKFADDNRFISDSLDSN